jgi:hypothetical protein
VRQRAGVVLQHHLNDQEDAMELPTLVIEIEQDDDDDELLDM